MKTIIKTAATFAAIAAIGGGLLAVNASASSTRRQLTRQVTVLDRQVTVLDRQLAAEHRQIINLTNQVGVLNVPSDPLSAYNSVCNQPMTTPAGLTETYWFPCTNSAQTIPQPGN